MRTNRTKVQREAGVRNLEREIANIDRALAKEQVEGNGKKFKTKFKVNLGSSYVQWNGPPALITYPAVVPFMFYF
jgi:ATP-dependent Lon protease